MKLIAVVLVLFFLLLTTSRAAEAEWMDVETGIRQRSRSHASFPNAAASAAELPWVTDLDAHPEASPTIIRQATPPRESQWERLQLALRERDEIEMEQQAQQRIEQQANRRIEQQSERERDLIAKIGTKCVLVSGCIGLAAFILDSINVLRGRQSLLLEIIARVDEPWTSLRD